MKIFDGTGRTDTEEDGTVSQTNHDVFVARQPIFDRRQRVLAYELLFRESLENYCPQDDLNRAASNVVENAWLTFGFSTLVGSKKAFVNFTRDLLVSGYGRTLPVESTVIELLETIEPDPEVLEACQRLKQEGYVIAVDDFVHRPGLEPLLELADIVKVAFRDADPAEQSAHVRRVAGDGPKLLAEQVETKDEYRQAVELGFEYFQGYFFCKPEIVRGRALNTNRLTHLKLLQAVTRPDLDVEEVDTIIRVDAAVTHRLMKYLGSAAFGFRAEITSVRHGLALLGREQIRRFVSLMALSEMGQNKPAELLVSAAVRGKFCELVGHTGGMVDRKPELFLLGILSLVDAMLDQPMAEILEELPLSADLKGALVGDANLYRPVLDFVERYERGDWTAVEPLGRTAGIQESKLPGQYGEALSFAAQALRL